MKSEYEKYNINLDVQFKHQERMDIHEVANAIPEKWANRTLTQVNNSVVRLGKLEGEFHWHKHQSDDEFFFVVEGKLYIEVGDTSENYLKGEFKTIELNPGQGITISKAVYHRPYSPQGSLVLMVETSDIQPTGD